MFLVIEIQYDTPNTNGFRLYTIAFQPTQEPNKQKNHYSFQMCDCDESFNEMYLFSGGESTFDAEVGLSKSLSKSLVGFDSVG